MQAALQADKLNSTDISSSLNQNTSQPQTLVDVLTAPCTTGSTQFTSTTPATSTTTLTTSANSITTPAKSKSMEDVKPDIKQEVQMEIKTEDIKQEPVGSCSGKEMPQVYQYTSIRSLIMFCLCLHVNIDFSELSFVIPFYCFIGSICQFC